MTKPLSLEELFLRDEGEKLTLYFDTLKVPTIGVGRNLRDVGISEVESRFLLDNDIKRVQHEVGAALPWTIWMVQPRRAVIYSMAFQMGLEGLLKFEKFLAAAQRQDWATAKQEGLDSLWAKQTPERAKRLMQQLETGGWV